MLYLNAFDHFRSSPKNKFLVSQNKYGVLVLTDGEWVPTEITEDDFVRYVHVEKYESEEEQIRLLAEAEELGYYTAPFWPLVKLIEW
jgi:hypothetical protein